MRGRGARTLFDSQMGKTRKQTMPITSIAMISPLSHPSDNLDAIVSEIKMRAKAPLRSKIPPRSSSNQDLFRTSLRPRPFQAEGAVNPIFSAFLLFKNKVIANGRNMAGRMMHHIPYPHLQVVVFRISFPIIDPIHTVTRNGKSGKVDHKARLRRSLVSAMKTCCRI
jgi:hypothetical protein